jgi:predicted RNA-binding Zn ribbon-like protein
MTHQHQNRPASVPAQPSAAPRADFDLDAGILCLDFANTLDDRTLTPREDLPDYAALLRFAEQTGMLNIDTIATLAEFAAHDPEAAHASHARAIELRETMYRVFEAIAGGHAASDADISAFNTILARSLPHGGIGHGDDIDSYAWVWETTDNLDRPLWPIAKSALDLLLGEAGDPRRVRQCAAHDCAWLFLDTSRNASRRWCSMQSCGNRAKVNEFRQRKRVTGDG